MATRTITYTLTQPDGGAWSGVAITMMLVRGFATGARYVAPGEVISSTSDGSGQGSLVVEVPDDGAGSWLVVLPDGTHAVQVAAGAPTTVHALLADDQTLPSPTALAAHAATIASALALGHIRVGTGLAIDGSGVLSASGGGGGAPSDAQYVALATNATLTNERVLTAGDNVTLTDAGAGSTLTVAVPSVPWGDLTSVPSASTSAAGIVELATSAETTAGLAVQASDTRLSDSRTPAAHASTHAAAGSDPLTLSQSQIASLVVDLAAKLAAASNLSDLANAGTARNNLGLGSLAVLSAITASLISDASANGRSLITAADYAAMRALLALVVGTNVQAWDADLDTLAGMGSTRAGLLAALPAFVQGLLDDADAATARGTIAAAPLAATYITQTANSELSAEQALSSLATGYMKVTTGTGVISSQAAPIPASDGGALVRGRINIAGTNYYHMPGMLFAQISTQVLTINQVRYEPRMVYTPITLDQLAIETTTAGGAGTTVRLGIYTATVDWTPDTLVLDAGTVAADGATGVKTTAINQVLTPGRYLFCLNSDGTPILRAERGRMLDMVHPGANAEPAAFLATQTYGAFPSTPTAITTVSLAATGFMNCIFARISTP